MARFSILRSSTIYGKRRGGGGARLLAERFINIVEIFMKDRYERRWEKGWMERRDRLWTGGREGPISTGAASR